uniref:tRNA-5-taurinomethyluridine 2-sulfurtransferase n=1 Tax=Mesocestoides corti TaxID=53468 RepID=A0A5K3EPU7_MESCO
MGVLSGPIRRVACAVSGGVDSAVSAYFLKRRGFDVVGVFMTNWDQQDESINCSTDVDREDARFICRTLGIKFAEVNFVKDYWNDVFVPTVESYSKGKTPNPDILCNRYVKFPKLAEITLKSSKLCHPSICADAFATGHYARNSYGNFLEKRSTAISPPQLLRSADPVKDQTFWLCNISWKHLQHCMFPIGDLTKPEVKKIATSIGLERIAKRRESMGICFIGKRNFGDFIDKVCKILLNTIAAVCRAQKRSARGAWDWENSW